MWKKILIKIITFFTQDDCVDDDYIDEHVEKYLEIKKRNLEMFERICGDTPMKQIDWILKHGLDRFNYWYDCCDNDKLNQPATVEQSSIDLLSKKAMNFSNNCGMGYHIEKMRPREVICETVDVYVRGGLGNKKLNVISHTVHHTAN